MKSNFINVVGKKYGYLTVVKYLRTDKEKRGATVWLCRCICGKEKEMYKMVLVTGRTKSCGCMQYKRGNRISRDSYAFNQICNHYKWSAKKRGLEWSLSKEQLKYFLYSPCVYCGQMGTALFLFKGCNFTYTGVDRKDNSKGYVYSNCVPCCITCNRAKHVLSMERWHLYLESVAAKKIFGQLKPVNVVEKVWGTEHWIVNNENYCTKILELKGGFSCSLHMHPLKRETFTVVLGYVDLEWGTNVDMRMEHLEVGDSRTIEPNTLHRFSSKDRAFILEMSTTHSDEDVIRIEPSKEVR